MPLCRRLGALGIAAIVAALVTACSGSDRSAPTAPLHPSRPAMDAGPVSLPDTIAAMIATLYPANERTALSTRWADVQRKLGQGQDAVAQSQFTELAQWVKGKTPNMLTPPLGETAAHAAGRLVLYMSLVVYRVPTAQQPVVAPGTDMAFDIATPTQTTQVVVPSQNAGVQIDPGSVSQPTVIVVSQITTPYYHDNCAGPLDTKACQYPVFYDFNEFPHARLLKPGHFQICHVQPGTFRSFLDGQAHGAIDSRLQLAHAKPANAADYTPGGAIVDGVEILPQSTNPVTRFVPGDCNGVTYPSTGFAAAPSPQSTGIWGSVMRHLAAAGTAAGTAIGRMLTPRDAYAFDQGVEHLSLEFSPFGAVDTLSRPDPAVSNFSATGPQTGPASVTAHPGDTVAVSFSITNTSLMNGGGATATSAPTTASVLVTTDAALTTLAANGPAAVIDTIPALVPDRPAYAVTSQRVVLPAALAPGTYHLGVSLAPPPGLPEANLTNDTASVTLNVTPAFVAVNWSSQAAMPTARRDLAADTLGGLLYAVGGYNGTNVAALEAYDPLLNSWQSKAAMPSARHQPVAGTLGGKLYVAGGYNPAFAGGANSFDGALSTLEAYDPGTDSWTLKASMSVPRRCPSAGVINGILYVVGGANTGAATSVSTLEAYNPTTNTWTTKAPMPTARFCAGSAVVNGLLYVIGGFGTGPASLNVVEVYDPSTDSWSTRAPMPTPRYGFALGYVNGFLYAAGGNNLGTVLNVVERYDPVADSWVTATSMPTARSDVSGAVVGGRFYVVGGTTLPTAVDWLITNERMIP